MASMTQHITATLTDGTVVEVDTIPADQIRWETTAGKQKWPAFKDAPILWGTFLTWAAGQRTGQHSLTWEAYRDQVADLSFDNGDQPDPTEPEPSDETSPPSP